MSITQELQNFIAKIVSEKFPSLREFTASISLSRCRISSLGDFQCNDSMRWAKFLGVSPQSLAEELRPLFLELTAIDKVVLSGPGFINFSLNQNWVVKALSLSVFPKRSWRGKKVILDYSSPNVAKEMHVGHLRSTVIGESLGRIIEFLGGEVLRINHLGDWGTQFGMLLAYIEEINGLSDDINLEDVLGIYQMAKKRFDTCADFKEKAQGKVVALQNGEAFSRKIWQKLCEISEENYDKIYAFLGVSLISRGESFYQNALVPMVESLRKEGWAIFSDGACCVFIEGYAFPYMLQKSDGGFNYDTTDLAALKYRVEQDKGDVLIYVTDSGQQVHFQLLEAVAKKVGYLPDSVRFCHVPFGLVLREDGKKFQTRSGNVKSLMGLLQEAVASAKRLLEKKSWTSDDPMFEEVARKMGVGAVKFLDLVNHRISDYKFSYEKMLQLEGKTAPFLMYARVRALSILRKLNMAQENLEGPLNALQHETEWELVLRLLQFSDVIEACVKEMTPHLLAQYGYDLARQFNAFFRDCRVEGDPKQEDRAKLCHITVLVLTRVLNLLGIDHIDRM